MNGTRVSGTAKMFKYGGGNSATMNACGQTYSGKPHHMCVCIELKTCKCNNVLSCHDVHVLWLPVLYRLQVLRDI